MTHLTQLQSLCLYSYCIIFADFESVLEIRNTWYQSTTQTRAMNLLLSLCKLKAD